MNFNAFYAASKRKFVNSAISLFLCCIISGCGERKEKEEARQVRPVKLFTVGAEEDSAHRFYPATIRSGRRVKLAFQVPGQIIEFPVKPGQQIRKGELLGRLNSHDYENTLKSAISRYKESKTDFMRYSKLVEKKAVSVALFEGKRKAFEIAEAEMKIAAKALLDTRLTAPFDGVIAATYVDNFQNVQAKQEILSFQGTSDVELIISVPEKDVINVPAHMPLLEIDKMFKPVAVFPALKNMSFPLKSKEFETEADSATHTFRAVFIMPSPKEFSIMPGMTALARVSNGRKMGVSGYRIPAAAALEDSQGTKHVWLVADNMTAHKRPVTVGAMSEDRIIVKDGLKKGDVIIAAGANFVSEGMKVRALSHIGGREIRKAGGTDK
jgi:RND family efflux transporter MFP subunit